MTNTTEKVLSSAEISARANPFDLNGPVDAKLRTDWADRKHGDTIILFDVDGTLTVPRLLVNEDMLQVLKDLRKNYVIGFVGGSDLVKQKEQLGSNILELFDFAFPENGLTSYRLEKCTGEQKFLDYLGEERYQELVNFILRYIADLKIPKKRGTFLEYRNGMINVSPIGRNCSQAERIEFEQYDLAHKIRETMVAELVKAFPDFNMTYSIGGQISFDVFPTGWDKTFCLRHLAGEGFRTVHFFGDKTFQGGNDFEIYNHPSVKGHHVNSPTDTISILKAEFDF
ncbi:hypothetical protein H696_05907 [Fonticula alba]|uniref:Phosphomannomutase n=1 Tax=Fonticula alba TaxID=691883 RepID=A0A058Z045_FONAL|nr:hypothetical protein H696_05907 [Fonticula alba]KCV67620.1 hypothetical protein H696_05907 [Fonticula alba]|eukprot:XP_009497958.1 hypothetical protein H696_05907 [Fonticula alba]